MKRHLKKAASLAVCSAILLSTSGMNAKAAASAETNISELQNLSVSELETKMASHQQIMRDAHDMADAARALGMSENSITIQLAQGYYQEAKDSCLILRELIEQKQPVFTFDVFTKTNLSAAAFNQLLEGTAMAGHGQDFYDMEQEWNVNGLFAMSVARTESGLGTSNLARNKNNYFGMLGCSFSSPRSGILYFGQLMNKPWYQGKSIENIAQTYCPPTWKQWARQNRSFMESFWNRII